MRRQLPVGVVSEHPCANFGSVQPGEPDGESCHLLLGQTQADRQALEPLAAGLEFLKLLDIAFVEINRTLQRVKQGGQVLDLLWNDLKAVGHKVFGQRHPITVQDQAPIRGYRRYLDLIFP